MKTMQIERKCMQCAFAVKDPNATPDQIIQGAVPSMCLRNPPVSQVMITQRGMAVATTYPQVNEQTVSCWSFDMKDELKIAQVQ